MNLETCRRHLLQVLLPVLLATTALATETDPCPKLEVVPTSSGGDAVAVAGTGTGGTDVQTAEAIPEEGGNWKAERPVAVTGKALTKFTVTPSDSEGIATLWHKLDSPSTQATAQTNGAGELKLRLVAQEGAPSSATVIVDIYRTILPSSSVQGSLTLDGNAYSLAQAFVEHEQQSYTLNVGEELPIITLSGSASLSGMGALVTRGADDPAVSIVTTFEHDAMGRTTRRVIERGDRQIVTAWTYDPMGRLLDSIQDPGSSPALNLVTSRAYDPHGKLETRTDPRGIVTKYEYDHRNRLKKRIEAFGTLNLTTEWFRDGNGNVERRVDPEQHQTVYIYNEQNFRTQSTDAGGYVTTYTPDPAGNVLRMDRGLNPGLGGPQYSVKYVYDALHRVTQRIVAPDLGDLNLTTRYEYALSGGGCGCSGTPGRAVPHKITDPKGKVT